MGGCIACLPIDRCAEPDDFASVEELARLARFQSTSDRAPFDVALTEAGGREVEDFIERDLHGLHPPPSAAIA
jgi:hypothetical protein